MSLQCAESTIYRTASFSVLKIAQKTPETRQIVKTIATQLEMVSMETQNDSISDIAQIQMHFFRYERFEE